MSDIVYSLFTGDTCAKMRTLGQFISLLHNVCYFNVCYCTKTVRILDFEAFRRSEFSGRSLSCLGLAFGLESTSLVTITASIYAVAITSQSTYHTEEPVRAEPRYDASVNVAISPFAQHLKQNIAVSANLAKCGFMFLSRVTM